MTFPLICVYVPKSVALTHKTIWNHMDSFSSHYYNHCLVCNCLHARNVQGRQLTVDFSDRFRVVSDHWGCWSWIECLYGSNDQLSCKYTNKRVTKGTVPWGDKIR